MGDERLFANCSYSHAGQVSCSACGWVILDDTVFLDDHFRPLELHAAIFEGMAVNDGQLQDTKMTFMWLEEADGH